MRGTRNGLGPWLLLVLCVALAMPARAEDWVNTGAGFGSFAAAAVDRESIVPVPGLPYTLGAWFRFRFATSVDCSPPRGCYAASQRNYYHVNCLNGTIAFVQRLYLDLNDNVLTKDDYAPWYYYVPTGMDAVSVATACALYRQANPGMRYVPHLNPWPGESQ